ncbi:hypothetical protein ACW0US_17720 [Xanthomonas euvesicatoria]
MSQGSKKTVQLHLVPSTLSKQEAHAASNAGKIVRVMQSVYLDANADLEKAFAEYGLRLAAHFYPNASLSHTSAYFKAVHMNRVFIGGDYPYKKVAHKDGKEVRIVQSVVHPDYSDERLYELYEFDDALSPALGSFSMYSATDELVLIQNMDATKVNPEKHLPYQKMLALWNQVQRRAGGREKAWLKLEEIAEAVGKPLEGQRFYKQVYLKGI